MPLDFAALDQIIRGRGADKPCPMCGGDDWETGQSLTAVLRASKDEPGEVQATGHALPAFMYVCMTCGFVRLHALFALENPEA